MKRTIIFLMLVLLSTSVWAGTFRDDFNDGKIHRWWFQEGEGIWKVENGELVFQSQGDASGLILGKTTWKDYTVGVRAKIVKNQTHREFIEGIGIIGRTHSKTKSYFFGFALAPLSGKRVLIFNVDGSLIIQKPVGKAFQWRLDTWYNLRVVARESQFELYIDDTLMLEYTDEKYPSGKIGIVGSYEFTSAHFDDFFVTGDDVVPDDIMAMSVSPKTKLATTWATMKREQ
jgi:hypothetical protein